MFERKLFLPKFIFYFQMKKKTFFNKDSKVQIDCMKKNKTTHEMRNHNIRYNTIMQ